MLLLKRLPFVFVLALAQPVAEAQIKGNLLMPPQVDMTRSDWQTTLQNGNLTWGMPVASVPGEVPLRVAFGLNATYTATAKTSWVWDPVFRERVAVVNEVDRPMAGGIHFGYIADPSTNNGVTVEGLTVLENGYQVPDSQWTAFWTHSNLGSTLNLPQAYGFAAVSTTTAQVDPTATYLSYTTTESGFGATFQPVVHSLIPSGFGTPGTNYRVVLDKNKARVYAYASSAHAWVPVLWADRFGHFVKFQWTRSTAGLPAGISAITNVAATNEHGKGCVLRWADYTSNAAEADILRVDFVNIHAPSVFVKGYPGCTVARPSALGYPFASDTQWTVIPTIIGSACRPTQIQIGAYGSIPQPAWSNSGSTAAVAPGAPPLDGTSDSITRTWAFTYDPAKAELTSLSDSNGRTTYFYYTNYSIMDGGIGQIAPRGVSEVHEQNPSATIQRYMRWTRTFPSGSTAMSVKVEGWWDPLQVPSGSPDRYHLVVFPTDALNFNNGVYSTDTLKDTTGKVWRTTTLSYSSTGVGLNGSLSGLQTIRVQQDGSPTIITSNGYSDSTDLQITQQTVEALDATGTPYTVSVTSNSYASKWDMLEGHQLIQSSTTRYAPNGTTPLPTVTERFEYDPPNSAPPLLQLRTSYLDGGAVGQHGATYTYDTEGRPYIQNVYHYEGSTTVSSPYAAWNSYDPTTGLLASHSMYDQSVSGQTLTETFGAWNSLGLPTTTRDASAVTTSYTYDDRGRVLSVSRPGQPTQTLSYPMETRTDVTVGGKTTITAYDPFGRIQTVSTTTGVATNGALLSSTQTPTYDVYGRIICLTEVNPAGSSRSQRWTYDPLDRVTSATPVAGGMTTTSYSLVGVNAKVTNTLANQVSSSVLRDALGRVVEEDAPDGTSTKYLYDGGGHLASVTIQAPTGSLQNRSFNYDSLGRLISKVEPETGTQTFSNFNALNQPRSIIEAYGTGDARSRTVTYDGFGRTLGVVSGADSLSFGYSGVNLTSATRTAGGQSVSQSWSYSGPGGLLGSETTTQPGLTTTIGYTYDPTTGLLTELSYPNGRKIDYGYDTLGRVNSILNNGASLVSAVKYDDWGNRWQTLFASGAQDQWDADPTGTRLKTWSIGYVGGGPDSRGYTYDDATGALRTAGEWTLSHNSRGELIEADGYGIATTHAYDGFGNSILHQAVPNPSVVPSGFNSFTFAELPNNQIPGQEQNGALTGWNTNSRGEATQVGAATGVGPYLGLTWDGLGLLSSVSWNGNHQVYLYAPTGMRTSLADSANPGNNRKYAYDSRGFLLSEFLNPTGSPSWDRDVVYLGSETVAEIDSSGVHELHVDHLGTPRLVTKGAGSWPSTSNGTPEGTQAFGPYGESISQTGYMPLAGFTGHLQSDATGLVYMRGRYYSPAWHAFINSDQGFDPSTWNQKAYVGGSPFMGSDFSGMASDQQDGQWWSNYLIFMSSLYASFSEPEATVTVEAGLSDAERVWLDLLRVDDQVSLLESNPGGSQTTPQSPKPTKKCIGPARIKEGNRDFQKRNKPGAFGIGVSNGLAIIPSQWGWDSKSEIRPYMNSISGTLADGTFLFDEIVDIQDDRKLGPTARAQKRIIKAAGGNLVLEIYGQKDLGIQQVIITLPSNLDCPKGTKEVK